MSGRDKCLTSSNKKLVETSATLLGTSATLLGTSATLLGTSTLFNFNGKNQGSLVLTHSHSSDVD